MLLYLAKKILFIFFITIVFMTLLELVPYQRHNVYEFLDCEYESMLMFYGNNIATAVEEIKSYVLQMPVLTQYLIQTKVSDLFMVFALRFYGLIKTMGLDYCCSLGIGIIMGMGIKSHYFNCYHDFFNLRIFLNNFGYFISSFFVVIFCEMQIVSGAYLSIILCLWMALIGIRLSFVFR